MPNRIDLLQPREQLAQTVGHIMIKPELLRLDDPRLYMIKEMIMQQLVAAGQQIIIPWTRVNLPQDLVGNIYPYNYRDTQAWIERWHSFHQKPTEHILFQGENASLAGTIIRGRVSCTTENCFRHIAPGLTYPQIEEHCPTEPVKTFGEGCGMRAYLARNGYIEADEHSNDSTWNGLHASSPDDTYLPQLIEYLQRLGV